MVLKIQIKDKKDFYRYWLSILQFAHKLTKRESEALLLYILKREELKKSISDISLLRETLMSLRVRKEIVKEMNYSDHKIFYYNIINKLRKKKAFININGQWDINATLMPKYSKDFNLTIEFVNKND